MPLHASGATTYIRKSLLTFLRTGIYRASLVEMVSFTKVTSTGWGDELRSATGWRSLGSCHRWQGRVVEHFAFCSFAVVSVVVVFCHVLVRLAVVITCSVVVLLWGVRWTVAVFRHFHGL